MADLKAAGLGSAAHAALINEVVAHYRGDERIRAVVVFGSVATGAWHSLSDVDLDVVVGDDIVVSDDVVGGDDVGVSPGEEVAAIFGARAAVTIVGRDSVDVVLDSLEELSIRWHPLATTSPNITRSAVVVAGELSTADIVAAGEANQISPEQPALLDEAVRHAIGASKAIQRGQHWLAVAEVDRVRGCLVTLRGRRDALVLDPADPAAALARVLAEVAGHADLGSRRRTLLDRAGDPVPPP